jgi:hypothetical protein
MPNYAEEQDLSWKKPDWATNGPKLKSTGKGDEVKSGGNLAAPITNLPHQKEDGPFQKPEWTGDVANKESTIDGDLAKPITNLPHADVKGANLAFEKPDWTKQPVLKSSNKGEALKSGAEIARPIGGIKPVDD